MSVRLAFSGGIVVGALLTAAFFSALTFSRLASLATDDSQSPDEVYTLRSETLGLRELALPVVVGRTLPELSELGAMQVEYAFDGAYVARFETGRVYLKIDGSEISDILTFCWRFEHLCVEGETI